MLLEGKRGLILGVANKWSIAWGIVQSVTREGARVALTYQGERLEKNVRDLAPSLDRPGDPALRRDARRGAGRAGARPSSRSWAGSTSWCTPWPSPSARSWTASS